MALGWNGRDWDVTCISRNHERPVDDETAALRKMAARYWIMRDHIDDLIKGKKRIPSSLKCLFQDQMAEISKELEKPNAP